MRHLKRNPFEYFGLTPQVVKEFDDETLFKLIKHIYRVLQLKHHPDRGGDPKKALELNLAFESINYDKNPQSFQQYKKQYLGRLSRKTLKKQLEELETQYRKLTFQHQILKERFWHYIEKVNSGLNELYKQGLVMKIKVFDIISHINFSDYVSFKRKNYFFKELILSEGLILRKNQNEKRYTCLKRYRFIGSIKREYLEPWNLMQRDLREERFFLKDYILKDTFIREALIFLTPEVRVNSYLFFFHPAEPEKVFLEGIALKLEEITRLEFLNILKNETVEQSLDNLEQEIKEVAEL